MDVVTNEGTSDVASAIFPGQQLAAREQQAVAHGERAEIMSMESCELTGTRLRSTKVVVATAVRVETGITSESPRTSQRIRGGQ